MLKRFFQLEMFGLYALGFTLPIMESPKHFAFVFFVVGAVGRRILDKNTGWRRPDTMERLLLAMWAVALISTIINWPLVFGLKGIRNISSLLVLFWLMYRGDYTAKQIRPFLWAVGAGVVVGLIWGIWEWQHHIRPHLEFHSAGIVTQSSIYLGVSIFIFLGVLLDTKSGFLPADRWMAAAVAALGVPCVFVMGSRGGVLALLAGASILALIFFGNKKFRRLAGAGLLITALVVVGAMVQNQDSILKNSIIHLTDNIGANGLKLDEYNNNDLLRFEHWKVGYVQATRGGHPFFGIGPRNFYAIDVEKLGLADQLVTYKVRWIHPQHAHNLFLTKWAEEGFVGLALFVAFFLTVALQLAKNRPRPGDIHWSWPGAMGALVVPVAAGFFNSAFVHEFAWLAMLVMGLGLGRIRREHATGQSRAA